MELYCRLRLDGFAGVLVALLDARYLCAADVVIGALKLGLEVCLGLIAADRALAEGVALLVIGRLNDGIDVLVSVGYHLVIGPAALLTGVGLETGMSAVGLLTYGDLVFVDMLSAGGKRSQRQTSRRNHSRDPFYHFHTSLPVCRSYA